MVDFRYHIVSLISVFLALAIGIVLGAGPLRENLGDSLTNQVATLREEKEVLRAELQESTAQKDVADALMLASGRELIAARLATYTVTTIEFGPIAKEDSELIGRGLETAQATTSPTIRLTDQWWEAGRASFRSGIATSLIEHMDPVPPDASSTDFILGMALAQALTARDPQDPVSPTAGSAQILQILASANLIEAPEGEILPAHALIVLLPSHLDDDDEEAPDYTPWVQALAGVGQVPAVAVAEQDPKASALGDLRADPDAVTAISSTDSLGKPVSEILLPRILAHEILGNRAHFAMANPDYVLWPGPAGLEPWSPTPVEEEPADDGDNDQETEQTEAEDTDADTEETTQDEESNEPQAGAESLSPVGG